MQTPLYDLLDFAPARRTMFSLAWNKSSNH